MKNTASTTKNMTLEELKAYFGNSNKFSQATKMSHTSFANWAKRGYIPYESQKRIEAFTEGALKLRLEDLYRGA